MLVLELVSPGGLDIRIEARPGQAVEIGRATLGALGLSRDRHLSARHFVVVCERGQCHVRDLGSTNGTYVNGARVAVTVLREGDRIEAGNCTFMVRMHRDAAGLPVHNRPSAENEEPIVEKFSYANARRGNAGTSTDTLPDPGAGLTAPFCSLASATHFPLAMHRWEDSHGTARLNVVVKTTFTISSRPQAPTRQLSVFPADVADDRTGSVRFESDLVPFKPRTDIVLVGRAYAPGGKPVTQVIAGLRVGSLRYGVVVLGDRTWQWRPVAPPTISEPEPFTSMDLTYERAFGGIDGPGGMYCKENLVGTGFIGKKTRERISGLKLPNIEDPRNLITAWDTHPRPVGFGFYGRGWMPRLTYAGTYGEQYMKQRHPLPPADFSYRFFNGAHPDLQVEGYLRGDEEVVLVNVCPQNPDVRFRLPGVVPKITLARWTVPPEQWIEKHRGPDGSLPSTMPLVEETVKPVLDTLLFVPDEGIFYEVFRGVCGLSSVDSLEVARITIGL